ncbi:MAG: hypothetical protein HGA74_19020 [Deltaproteobacteria bacterium]|jgi:hypothetical protein|nr:hypothetical protein [Deltaproteobacteria bacterium]
MLHKVPICPHRIRQVPKQFSWVDHRLVRDRYLESCSHAAAALYLFLVTVADSQGLSYYSDCSLMKRLSMDAVTLKEARNNLVTLGLVAYEKPLYQVLPLPEDSSGRYIAEARAPMDSPLAIGELFRRMMGGRS